MSQHPADTPRKPEKINDDSDDGKRKEGDSDQKRIRNRRFGNVRGLLNKMELITDGDTTTEESLTKQFLDYEVYKSPAIKEIVSIIVEKAADEPKFSDLYLRLCLHQIAECDNSSDYRFRYALHYGLQKALNFDVEKGGESDHERMRNRRFGSVKFIAQLFLCGLTTIRFDETASFNYSEDSIEGAIQLLELIGYRLQEGNESIGAAVTEGTASLADLKQFFPFGSVFADLQRVKPAVSSRIRFMIDNLEKQRANGWKSRTNPKVDEEVLITNVRAFLNKMQLIADNDTTTEESLIKEFLDHKVYQSPALREIVSIIVDLAVEKPMNCERLSRLCRCQRLAELSTTGIKWSIFGDALLSGIDEFDMEKESINYEKKQIDSPESLNKLRSRRFGSVIFIGHLVLSGFIPFDTFVYCVLYPLQYELIAVDTSEESMACLIILLGMISERLKAESTTIMQQMLDFYYEIFCKMQETCPDASKKIMKNAARIERERIEKEEEERRIREEEARIERARLEKREEERKRKQEEERRIREEAARIEKKKAEAEERYRKSREEILEKRTEKKDEKRQEKERLREEKEERIRIEKKERRKEKKLQKKKEEKTRIEEEIRIEKPKCMVVRRTRRKKERKNDGNRLDSKGRRIGRKMRTEAGAVITLDGGLDNYWQGEDDVRMDAEQVQRRRNKGRRSARKTRPVFY